MFDMVSRMPAEAGICHMGGRARASNHSGGMAWRFLLYKRKHEL